MPRRRKPKFHISRLYAEQAEWCSQRARLDFNVLRFMSRYLPPDNPQFLKLHRRNLFWERTAVSKKLSSLFSDKLELQKRLERAKKEHPRLTDQLAAIESQIADFKKAQQGINTKLVEIENKLSAQE